MPARHYGQFLDASDVDQDADDIFDLASAPPEVVRGSFTIYYRPRDDSSYASARTLVSVEWNDSLLSFGLESDGSGNTTVTVRLGGEVQTEIGPVTFAAQDELALTFSGSDATITLSGAATGNGTSDAGVRWNIAPGLLRLGGNVLGGEVARGLVSLPYAVPGAVLPDPGVVDASDLDFSNPDNSGLLSLF